MDDSSPKTSESSIAPILGQSKLIHPITLSTIVEGPSPNYLIELSDW